jgi:putative FmdB family regulatory protein
MPIYEYRCATCGFEKEYLQKVSDPLLTDCPDCGKPTFTKLVSAAGFQLKGNGWYATDFKNKGKSPEKTKDSEKSESAKEEKKESPSKDSAASPAGGTGASPACT